MKKASLLLAALGSFLMAYASTLTHNSTIAFLVAVWSAVLLLILMIVRIK